MALYAFDGTWNSEKDAGKYDLNTNVVRFKDLYSGTKFFYQGVGTRHGALGKFLGGAFGVGGHDRIEDATRDLARQLAAGDTNIDIVGFSRGAALAVHFANVIGDDGVKVNGTRVKPAIRFLGVWDIVAAFGLANLGLTDLNIGHHLSMPKAATMSNTPRKRIAGFSITPFTLTPLSPMTLAKCTASAAPRLKPTMSMSRSPAENCFARSRFASSMRS